MKKKVKNLIKPVDEFTIEDLYGEQSLHIPLQFWFNRNAGLALPLRGLYPYNTVNICLSPGTSILSCID